MTDHPTTALLVGATGSIGAHVVAETLRQGDRVRAMARDTITVR
jgi:uncharacterized protein YbjT (DUF2867 family)